MVPRAESAANKQKLAQVGRVLEDLLNQALRPQFFGKLGIELSVQDGTIQRIVHCVERIER